jgi:hypothetical protein
MFQLIMVVFRLPSIIQGGRIFLMYVGLAVSGMQGIIMEYVEGTEILYCVKAPQETLLFKCL